MASGKTPAGMHRPIMVPEIMEVLRPKAGEVAVDCTLGYGGHAEKLLAAIGPEGRLLGLDADLVELSRTEQRLGRMGYGPGVFTAHHSNFAGLPQVLAGCGLDGADVILADLGVSSMQLDDPARGFSVKWDGPLDMRMNPGKGQPASAFLRKVRPADLKRLLSENADESHAGVLADALAGHLFATTRLLAEAIREALPHVGEEARNLSIRRVFQAVRIAVNDEFSALEMFLRNLPFCLRPGGRAAILTFHSGEDRRVKKAFEQGSRDGTYAEIARDVIRPGEAELYANPRSSPAKLRWARKTK